MIRRMQYSFLLSMAGAIALALLPDAVSAQVVATPTVTLNGSGLYHYDYTIFNNTPDELLDVSIHVLPVMPGESAVFNLTAPTGFNAFYTDPGAGLLDYVEDTPGIFAPGATFSGFTYDSFIAPQTSVFDATRLDLINGGLVSTTDATIAAVPEPGSMALLGAMSAAAGFAMRRRRRNTKSA